MVDDQIKVTHDNNGRFYRIKMDLAKEGSEIWDLTPYFKGRVGDNRFGLQVVWTYQGRLLDTTGMKPYIEGNVGNYSFDDKKDLQLAPDAATVRYTGNPSDCQSGGRVTYYFPEQMFPKEGIFKGYIGLLDDRDDSQNHHISGVTVWFKVLPNIAEMGHACDYYISDLEKAEEIFKAKLRQHETDFQAETSKVISDARNTYNSETENAHDALIALQAELSRTREDNNNLSDLIQSVVNNIKANNIVTRPEYDKLANEIVNRLSQINTKPDYYDNYNDMIAANPNGTQDLCVTADNQHKWLYVNNQWLDLGEFSYADIAPALKNSLYSQDHENALVNPDMRDGAYGWNIEAPWVSNPDNNIGNSQSYGILLQNEPPQGKDYEIFQSPIPVYKHKVLSAGVRATANGAENAHIQVIFRDANDNILMDAISKAPIPQNISDWQTVKLENISIPANAVSAAFTIAMQGKGVVNICQPIVNFDPYLLPYSIKEAREQLSYNQDNALVNPDMRDGGYGWNVVSPWAANSDNNIGNSQAYGIYVKDEPPKNVAYEIFQDQIPVYKHKVLSAGVKVTTDSTETATIQILFRDANDNILMDAISKAPIPQNISDWQTVKLENISIPDNAVNAAFTIAMQGKGVVNICQPIVNFDPYLLPYSIKEAREQLSYNQDNALVNPDMRDGGYGWNVVSPWAANSDNNIDNSQSYGIYVQNIPANTAYEIFQDSIPVYKRKVLSAGVKVTTNNAESAMIQVLFRDANHDIIDNAIYKESIPANMPDWQTIKLENVSIPDNAVSAAFTIAMMGKGVVNICQPMVNFDPYLLPYSTKELRDQIKPDHDNILLNPDLNEGAYGWYKDPEWKVDLANSVDNSSAYGINIDNYDGHTKEIYQATIDVRKRRNFSAGVMVSTLNAERAELQVLLRDANGKIIDSTVKTAPIPQNTQGSFQLVKIEDQSIPAEAATGSIAFCMEGNGVLVVRQPRFYFEPFLYPYSIKEVQDSLTEMQENESHKLPYFTFNTDAANVNDKWITAPFAYNDGLREIKGYAQIAIQGDSSRGYPKKNYKIKLFSDSDCKQKMKIKMKANWASLANFNLKANWIDATQSRNLVGAKLMADATAVTPFQDDKVAENLSKSQAYGQMEGFPIEVWFGTDYHGLYSCNTKKADSSFGMDKDTKGTAVISVLDNVNNPSSQTLRIPTAKLDNVAYADELHDTPDPDLVTNWSAWLDFVNNSSDTDFKAKLSNYIDINSAINLYLFGVMSREYDYESKSVLYLTWDNGKTYYLVAYDLDSNWGQNAFGVIEGNPQDDKWGFSTETASHKDGNFVDNAGMNKLFERMFKLFKSEIKQQYQYLRKTVWRNDQIIKSYKDYLDKIPEASLEKDEAKWPQIPSVKDNNFEQLHQIITQRCNQMDNWIEQLVPPVQPAKPTQTTQTGSQPTTPQAQPTEPKQ